MTLVSASDAKRMIEGGEAKLGSAFRHCSTGDLYVVLDLGKGSNYAVLNLAWEKIFKESGLLKEEA